MKTQGHTQGTACAAEPARTEWAAIVDRQTGLLTERQNRILRDTRVLMLGVGGMGMNAAAHLVRAGFEKFTLVDFDTLDGTSRNRTPFAFDDTAGEQKVEATRRYILKVNPAASVVTHPGVKLDLHSYPAYMRKLVDEHDVLSWAMDGMAGRIYYTRITHEMGQRIGRGKPAVESWAVPNNFVVWTIPNSAGSPTWEEHFDLPTARLGLEEIGKEELQETRRVHLKRLAELPGVTEAIEPGLMKRWLALEIPNRSFGPFVGGCGALIACEIVKNALEVGGEPLRDWPVQRAPWMAVFDIRRNVAYECNFRERLVRWRHPVTGNVREEQYLPPAAGRGER